MLRIEDNKYYRAVKYEVRINDKLYVADIDIRPRCEGFDLVRVYEVTDEEILFVGKALSNQWEYAIDKIINKEVNKMKEETRKRLMEVARSYENDQLELFIAELGWEDWMNEYTDASDDEEITEAEAEAIDEELKEIFNEAHKDF